MKNPAEMAVAVGQNLKRFRRESGWSLDKTAVQTGVSKAMLGQIERGESSPTIATLWKIATGMNVSFSSFLAPTSAASGGSESFQHDPDMQVVTLFPYSPDTRFEVFEITLTNHHVQYSTAHQIGVTEHLHVQAGELRVLQNDEWVSVPAGEQFILRADTSHAYQDVTGQTRFIDIIHYP